jgi:hypothetical protein
MFRWLAPRPSRRDLMVAAALTVISMVVVAWLGRDTWFFADAWDFLDRDLGSLPSLLRPHNGHLQAPVALVHQILYSIFGFDFWPWYFLPRVIGYGVMAYAAWYVMRRRGADATIAWMTLVILLFLGTSTFLTAATIGHHLVIPALALAAALYDAGGPRDRKEQAVLAGLLALLVLSTSLGVAAAAGLGVVALVTGRFWRVLPSFLGVGAAYLVWYVAFPREGGGALDISLDALVALPGNLWTMVPPAFWRSLSVSSVFGPALVLTTVAAMIWWVARRRMTVFDGVWLATALAYMGMVIMLRVATGRATADSPRYGYLIMWMLIFVIVPHLRLPERRVVRAAIVVAVIGVVGLGNIGDLRAGFAGWDRRAIRTRTETVGALRLAGEKGHPRATMDIAHGNELTVEMIDGFLADGWRPVASNDEEELAAARGVMRLASTTDPSRDLTACSRLREGESLDVAASDDGRLVIQGRGPTTVDIVFTDDFGTGTRVITWRGRRTLYHVPDENATITLTLRDGGQMTACSSSLASR